MCCSQICLDIQLETRQLLRLRGGGGGGGGGERISPQNNCPQHYLFQSIIIADFTAPATFVWLKSKVDLCCGIMGPSTNTLFNPMFAINCSTSGLLKSFVGCVMYMNNK